MKRILVIVLTIVLTFITFLLVGFMVLLFTKGIGIDIKNKYVDITKAEIVYDKEYDLDDISITNTSGKIIFKYNDKDNIRVVIYGNDKDEIDSSLNSNINVKVNEKMCIGLCLLERKIIVYIPYDYNNNININTISGDIDILKGNDINITSTSGKIKINSVNNLDISNVSGKIDIDSINSSVNIVTTSGKISINKLDIKKDSILVSVSGDVRVNNTNSNNKVSTVSGKTNINSNNISNYNLIVNTISGNIYIGG